MFYDPLKIDRDVLRHDPFKALVAPRPVGWVATRSASGAVNLAPYSFFNAVSSTPPMLAFSSAGLKDSVSFARESGEFTWSLATWELREAMNESSAALPRGVSEFKRSGLTPADGVAVACPRVAESPCSMECKVLSITELTDVDGASSNHHLVVGQVVGIHLDDAAVVDGTVDTTALRPIARCGGTGDYAVVDELFHMPRPDDA